MSATVYAEQPNVYEIHRESRKFSTQDEHNSNSLYFQPRIADVTNTGIGSLGAEKPYSTSSVRLKASSASTLTTLEPYSPAIRQLAEIAALTSGWDGDDANSPTAYAVARAFYLADLIRKMTEVVLVNGRDPVASIPLSDGGIQIEWENESVRFEVEIEPDGSMSLLEVKKIDRVDRFHSHDKVSLREAAKLIGKSLRTQ